MSAATPDQERHDDLPDEVPDGVPDHAQYLGTDGKGADHYWSMYQQTDYIVERDGRVQSWPLGETPCPSLGTWCYHIRNVRGPWEDLRVDADPSAVERYIAERNIERDQS